MLSGKNFRGSHQRSLISIGSHKHKGEKGQNRLSASHISLNQPVHTAFSKQVLFDFLPYPALGPCKLIGKPLDQTARVRGLDHGKGRGLILVHLL